MCGIDLPVLFVAACCWALTILITISEGSSRWASRWSTSLPELDADDCKHRRAGGWCRAAWRRQPRWSAGWTQ